MSRLLLVQNGSTNYRIVVPVWKADRATAQKVQAFSERIREKSGVLIPFASAESGQRTKEIMVRCEHMRESADYVRDELTPWFGYAIKAVDENLVVSCYDVAFLEDALTALADALTFGEDGSVACDAELFLRRDYTGITEAYPKYAAQVHCYQRYWIYQSSDGDYEISFLHADPPNIDAYRTELQDAGWTCVSENAIGDSRFYTYEKACGALYLSCYPAEKMLHIVASAHHNDPLPSEPNPQKVCIATFAQPDIDGKGLQLVTQLQNGKFVIVDSGFPNRGIEDRLLDYLVENAPQGEKPTIAAWFITHTHMDHICAANLFLEKYHDRVELEAVAYNFPDYDTLNIEMDYPNMVFGDDFISRSHLFERLTREYYPDLHYWKIRSGQRWQVGNFTAEILSTHEALPDKRTLVNSNHMCSAFRFCFGDWSVLILGDSETNGCLHMAKVYGNALKCTALQASHHGLNGAVKEIYECADPDIVFWPCSAWWFEQPQVKGEQRGYEFNRVLRDDAIRKRTHHHSSKTTVYRFD